MQSDDVPYLRLGEGLPRVVYSDVSTEPSNSTGMQRRMASSLAPHSLTIWPGTARTRRACRRGGAGAPAAEAR
jgi:hypothetical protein